MSHSRISKLVFEAGAVNSDSLREAEQRRSSDILLVVGDRPEQTAVSLARTATALSLRCFGGQVIVCAPSNATRVREAVAFEAATYGAPERLSVVDQLSAPTAPCIGLGAAVGDAFADASGWTSSVNALSRIAVPATSPAVVFATCCAFAKLFAARVLGQPRSSEAWTFSLATFGTDDERTTNAAAQIDLGRIALLGAGAIGSAFCYTLLLSGWKAEIDIIDDDCYAEPNHETTFLIGRPEVLRGRSKAKALSEIVCNADLIARSHVMRVGAESELLRERWDAFACAVDNSETRRALDQVNAGTLVNAAVGGSREDAGHVVSSRHLIGSDRPLSVLYPERPGEPSRDRLVPAEVRDDHCSRIAYESVSMAAPFLGGAAGALLVARCFHHRSGVVLPLNYLKLDLFSLQSKFQHELKRRAA